MKLQDLMNAISTAKANVEKLSDNDLAAAMDGVAEEANKSNHLETMVGGLLFSRVGERLRALSAAASPATSIPAEPTQGNSRTESEERSATLGDARGG